MEKDEIIVSRLKDLANRCYQKNIYTFTDFLSMAEVSEYHKMERELSFVQATLFGGTKEAERVVIRFGSEDQLGYTEDFPICCMKISPLMEKFADNLSHRDFLGALMNLGVERSVLGDIYVDEKSAYLFCLDSIAEYIIENLTRVRHTSVMAKKINEMPQIASKEPVEVKIQIPSERIDAIIARACHLSRDDSIELFRAQKVFLNGRLCESNSVTVKNDDQITVRGFGRFTYLGIDGVSKKGKINARISMVK